MNALEPTFARIESHEFSGLVNVANNLKTFLRTLADEPAFQELARAMVTPEARAAVFERIVGLTQAEAAEDCEHPYDAALAAYLSLLSDADRPLAEAAAAKVAERPGCWWARKVADKVAAGATLNTKSINGAGATPRLAAGQESRVPGRASET